ncbi:hypothetical protein L2E82_48792 [Cichorium intybus]|uniref:Uncharacterized protein n=1 Tax=Cichorium intybus TaxID=13427 RepID=A0ACB8YYX7_CICIN|nr:hypothetical protein L2E82_48792 [Cichorium intybus]
MASHRKIPHVHLSRSGGSHEPQRQIPISISISSLFFFLGFKITKAFWHSRRRRFCRRSPSSSGVAAVANLLHLPFYRSCDLWFTQMNMLDPFLSPSGDLVEETNDCNDTQHRSLSFSLMRFGGPIGEVVAGVNGGGGD